MSYCYSWAFTILRDFLVKGKDIGLAVTNKFEQSHLGITLKMKSEKQPNELYDQFDWPSSPNKSLLRQWHRVNAIALSSSPKSDVDAGGEAFKNNNFRSGSDGVPIPKWNDQMLPPLEADGATAGKLM
ncbi:hypothetical protein Nepgr_029136 [Nepenthes gracilis]|uniref:Uncharacterized protein n=1 Tax=Nepenthes gracilis TaxID=150966 RepID=A0AAD3TDN8_NEPGR|nr:hypothetical protein Nepgr_029136 [Nepenthes gracilis]